MSNWSYICPCCGKKIKTDYSKEEVSKWPQMLFRCEACLDILRINKDLTVSDFQKILRDNKKKRKAESKLQEPETIGIMEDFS